jgi:hypothetical protein
LALLSWLGSSSFSVNGLAAEIEQVLLLFRQLLAELVGLLFQISFIFIATPISIRLRIQHFPSHRVLPRDEPARHGHLVGDAGQARLAVGSSTPVISNITVPGFTIATQYSGSPLPLPMRVSSGLPDTACAGRSG